MRVVWLLPLALLGGCNQIGSVAGAAAGLVSGAGTANPGVAIAVGLGVNVVVDEVQKIYSRRLARNEQDQIAQAAGPLKVGDTVPWAVHHTIPIGNEHGDVTVLRDIPAIIVACREVLFTVQDGKAKAPYVARICLNQGKWTIADAEPAVERWGFLQ
jgi:hypothetical protein